MIRLILPAALLIAMAGCAQDRSPPAPAPAIPGVECNAEHLDSLIGKARSPEIEAEAKRLSGANLVRWLAPNAIVTMEFRADRLNLHLGTDGKIGSARCG